MRYFSKYLLSFATVVCALCSAGIVNAQTIEFGLGDRSGKAWGIGTERDNFIIINSSASVPGFATQENVNAFAGADLSEPLQLRLTVVHNNANPLVQILIKTPGHTAKYFADISAHTGTGSSSTPTVSTTTALGSPAEGSLGDLSAVEYIEVKGAWTGSTVRTHIRPRELTAIIGSGDSGGGDGGGGDPEPGALPVNTHAGQPDPEDGLGMDFNYLATTRSENLPFEWEVTAATQFNNKYSFFAHDPLPSNNDDQLTVQTGNSPNAGNNATNSHTAGSDILGDFRIKCQWSHFAYDDPIVFSSTVPSSDFAPGENKAHLHMFWGNTAVNWETNLIDKGDPNHIAAKGGSTCNGGALNRSSYWMPALMHNDDQVITPRTILVYYKTWQTDSTAGEVQHDPEDTNRMPQGLQLIAGNGNLPDGSFTESVADAARNLNRRHELHGPSNTNENIYWACGDETGSNVKFNRIPTYDEWIEHCTGILNSEGNIVEHPMLNATIFFPQCMQNEHELRSGSPHRWHVRDTVGPDKGCIRDSGFEHRIPRLGYLLYFDVKPMIDAQTAGNMDFVIGNLRLSSDPTTYNTTSGGADVDDTSGAQKVRGGTLHADWVAAWHDKVQDMWLDHCVRDGANCSVGNLGTGISLREYPRDYPGQDGVLDGPNDGTIDDYMFSVPTGSKIGDM